MHVVLHIDDLCFGTQARTRQALGKALGDFSRELARGAVQERRLQLAEEKMGCIADDARSLARGEGPGQGGVLRRAEP